MANKEVKKEKKHFWKDFKVELKKVIWPTPKQLVNNTSVVVGLVLITALIVFVLDLAFDSVSKYGITKLQTSLQSAVSNNDEKKVEEDNKDDNSAETDSQEETTEENKEETENVENTENQETTESNE